MRASARLWESERADRARRAPTERFGGSRAAAAGAAAQREFECGRPAELSSCGGIAGVTDGPFAETKEFALG